MTESQERLFGFMRRHQESAASFTPEDVAEYAGYRTSSVETMITRHFLNTWIFPVQEGRFVVREFADVTPRAFAAAVCQTTRLSFEDEAVWRRRLERLIAHGIEHGFPVYETVFAVLDELTHPGRGP